MPAVTVTVSCRGWSANSSDDALSDALVRLKNVDRALQHRRVIVDEGTLFSVIDPGGSGGPCEAEWQDAPILVGGELPAAVPHGD